MRSRHPDDFALLRYVAGDVDDAERGTIGVHVEQCDHCSFALAEVRRVDAALRTSSETELPEGDPFRNRPARPYRRIAGGSKLAERALAEAERGDARVSELLSLLAGPAAGLSKFLDRESLADPSARYLLLYALEEAGRRITEGPARCLTFAQEVLARIDREPAAEGLSRSDAEAMVPLHTLVGQAHVLAGQASNWTGALDNARQHLETAYRTFRGDCASDEIRLALTEYHESQRRSFAGQPAEGLALARRARPTLEEFGLDDYAVRARVAEGIALLSLGRDEEAVACFRDAVPFFERHGLWSNYVSAVNSLAASLARVGRLDEARREYSRALRKLSNERDASLLAFTRNGLAHVLFNAEKYGDAAKSFLQAARLFDRLELVGDALTASLWEIESWARSGDQERARHRLDIFKATVGRLEALDPFVVRQLEEALSGRDPDLPKIAGVRRRVEETIRERFEARAG